MGGWFFALLLSVNGTALGGTNAMNCDPDDAKLLSKGELYERQPWTEWRVLKCPGEKPSLWVFGAASAKPIYAASKGKLEMMGFLDGTQAARKLEDIGVSWSISHGTKGYKAPVWLFREGKNTLVFIDAGAESLPVLGTADAKCGNQIDMDYRDGHLVVTIRKADHGAVIEERTWAFSE